jgi:hypothetical protein
MQCESTINYQAIIYCRLAVSAFRDKLEVWREHFFDGHGKPIVAKYRERGIKRFGKEFYSKKNNFGSPAAATNADRTGASVCYIGNIKKYQK